LERPSHLVRLLAAITMYFQVACEVLRCGVKLAKRPRSFSSGWSIVSDVYPEHSSHLHLRRRIYVAGINFATTFVCTVCISVPERWGRAWFTASARSTSTCWVRWPAGLLDVCTQPPAGRKMSLRLIVAWFRRGGDERIARGLFTWSLFFYRSVAARRCQPCRAAELCFGSSWPATTG
jgi:hypothetical protein